MGRLLLSTRPKRSIAAIILAAGDSIRMGSPKALLPLGNQTFLGKIIADYRRIDCQPVIAVAGAHFDAIRNLLDNSDVLLLHNPDPDRGPFSSLKIAVKSLPPACQGFFVHPVDHPAINIRTLKQIFTAWRGEARQALKPTFEGRGGHPVLLGREWIQNIARAPISDNLRSLLRQSPADLQLVPVADEMILLNVNHPDDLEKLSPHV